MRRLAFITGILLILTLLNNPSNGLAKVKRSVDLNDVYQYQSRQNRLPKGLRPTSYRLEIEPSIYEAKFKGRVRINITWTDTSDRIILNAHPDLAIDGSGIKVKELGVDERKDIITPATGINVAGTTHNAKKSWYVIELEQMLRNGTKCEIDMKFTGNITTNKTSGLFRREYVDSAGKSHMVLGTYFRLDNAQNMFPCFDEPPYKTKYQLSVLRPKNMTALSNTELDRSTDAPGKPDFVWDHFKETPEMSTFQLALAITDFESISPTKMVNEMNGTRLNVKIWARKEYIDSLKNVPDKVVEIINYLQDYFNCSIGLPKLDLMAMPFYTATKSSDNWGLMFFKESELSGHQLWNIAYELIYQWIGQYRTPFRWSDVPVNKALNSFLASMTTVDINPDEMNGKWPMTVLYSLYYEFGKVFPFSRVAGIREEAKSAKTELIFRMFSYTLGKDLFRKGVRRFVQQENQEQSEEYSTNRYWLSLIRTPRIFFADDIYSRLNDVANETNNLPEGLTINEIAAPWIGRNRVPLVTVTRDYEAGTMMFSQKVFLRETSSRVVAKSNYEWDIPIVMLPQDNLNFSNTKPVAWMTKGNGNLTIHDITDKNSFIIVNPEEIGMFPVNYDSCNWKMLAEFLQGPNRQMIPVLTRAKLLHDAWNLAYGGELCFETALNMTHFLKNERSHVVWEPLFTLIDHVGRRIEGVSDVYAKFEVYIRSLLEPLYEYLLESSKSYREEPSWMIHMKGLTKNFLCRVGYQSCIQEAREQFKKWMDSEEPDKGNPVSNEFICPVFKWGTKEEWEFGLQRVINFPKNSLERKQSERTYLLKTLAGCTRDLLSIEKLLNMTLLEENSHFTNSDIQLVLSMLTGSAGGYLTLYHFLKQNWNVLKERYKDDKHLWDGIVSSATSNFNTQEGYDLVSGLHCLSKQSGLDSANWIIEDALKNILEETKWNEKNLKVINSWLTDNLSKDLLDSIDAANISHTIDNPHYPLVILSTPTPCITTIQPIGG
ncbi:aminopeptidase N isoform X3 [Cephus cinctus]|nr:aminopeptidase N isoform X3 [Cephus cinctus]XP_024941272.1 aminopeptidase N isoform X3 [Cephus cinctus]